MSVILEVLKKLDREKPSQKDHSTNLAAEILRADVPRPEKRIRLQVIIIFLTAVITAGVTYISLKEFGLFSQPSPPVPQKPAELKPPAPSVPLESSLKTKMLAPIPVNPPEPAQKVAPIPPPREPVSETKTEAIKVIPKTETVPESKITKAPEVSVEGRPVSPLHEEKKVDQRGIPAMKESAPVEPPKKGPETRVSEPAKAPPSFTLSAIVWYEDPSLRFAIVNGLKVVEGDFIEGAKVMEIHRTSIRFLYQERLFEVSISR